MLHDNIKNNKLNNVTVVESGLYNEDTIIKFSADNTDGGKISNTGENEISVKKLSTFINKDVDFLKLNIEGAELNVFQDLNESKKINLINELCFEWHSFSNEKQNLDKILKILTDNNFRYNISSLHGAPLGKFEAEKESQIYLMIYAKKNN
jgi:hypothetical protein